MGLNCMGDWGVMHSPLRSLETLAEATNMTMGACSLRDNARCERNPPGPGCVNYGAATNRPGNAPSRYVMLIKDRALV